MLLSFPSTLTIVQVMKCVRGFDAKKELPNDSIAGAQVGVISAVVLYKSTFAADSLHNPCMGITKMTTTIMMMMDVLLVNPIAIN